MSRRELIIIAIAAILLQVGAAMMPSGFREQYPWIWQILVGGAIILVIWLLLPTKLHKLRRNFLSFFPVKILRMLHTQKSNLSQFLYVQKPRFVFLPMSGGINRRKWSYEFTIVSCLFRDLRIDRIDIEITYPITETVTFSDSICLRHLGDTKIHSGEANMSDTSFYYLAEQSKRLKTKEYICIHLRIIGYCNGRKKFIIGEEVYAGELKEWGQNNSKDSQ